MENKTVKIICIIIYCIAAITGFVFAIMYLFRVEFMPYHEVAIGRPWTEISEEYRVLILALMRVSGGGYVASSVGILLLLFIPLRNGKYWPYLGIPAIGLSALIPTLIATLYVKEHSSAIPPYLLAFALIILLITTIILALIYKKRA